MIILGQTNDEKGTQLEQIAGNMLSAKGYRNIRFNAILAGGAEYDVTGEYELPRIGTGVSRTIRIVGECKARKDLANMTDWQKFLGKVLIEDIRQQQPVAGVFISLSGFNNPVLSSYDDVSRSRNNIEIVSGSEIQEYLVGATGACSLATIVDVLKQYTTRNPSSFELCYYSLKCYWLVLFEKGDYTLFNQDGTPLHADDAVELSPLIEETTSAHLYVDLQEEKLALQRKLLAKKEILSRLMLYRGVCPISQVMGESEFSKEPSDQRIDGGQFPYRLPSIDPPFSEAENLAAIEEMVNIGWLQRDSDTSTSENNVLADTISFKFDTDGKWLDLIEILRFWLKGDTMYISLYTALLSAFYDELINTELIEKILEIQGNLPFTEEEKQHLIQVLKLSPMALHQAITPIPMITTHRMAGSNHVTGENIDGMDKSIFFQCVGKLFGEDCQSQELAAYYCGMRRVVELEEQSRIVAKKVDGNNSIVEWRIRHAVRPSNVQGGFIHLWVPNDADEPQQEFS